MAIDFPDYSDLGLGHIGERTRYSWDYALMNCERSRYYFDGDVFQERVEMDGVPSDQAPLMFPVGLNLVKMLCIAQADSVFGEFDSLPVQFGVRQDQTLSSSDVAAIDLAHTILEQSNAPSLLWEHELERNVYGGGALRILPSLSTPGHIKWMRVRREAFFPIWDPDDPNELLEVFVITFMSAEQAFAKYRLEASGDMVRRVEHWTRFKFEIYLDKKMVDSGPNPWLVVPYVYTPRLRFSSWFGDALAPEIVPVQDELNMRVADLGEAINYNAHPVRWGLNLPRDFNADNFPLAPNAMWNLGRALGSSPPPEVGMLEAKNPVPQGVLDHINFLYDWTRTSSFAPPIAFGDDDGGGQRSGVTLEIRMWPLIKAIRRSRGYLDASLRKALNISAIMLSQKDFPDVPRRAIASILNGNIVPQFHSIMPRDQAAIVDEVLKLLTTDPPAISLETAQSILGRGAGEVDRIKAMMEDKDLWKALRVGVTMGSLNNDGQNDNNTLKEKPDGREDLSE